MSKKIPYKLIVGLVIFILAAVAVYMISRTSDGMKVTIEVVDDQGAKTTYEVVTEGEFLSDAMKDAEGLTFDGEEGDYGLYIKTVNGLTADYDTDGAYWSVLVNGEYGQYSADQQPLTEGDVYTLSYTQG